MKNVKHILQTVFKCLGNENGGCVMLTHSLSNSLFTILQWHFRHLCSVYLYSNYSLCQVFNNLVQIHGDHELLRCPQLYTSRARLGGCCAAGWKAHQQ